MRLRLLLRGLPKLIAAIAVAAVAGGAIGVALSVLAGDDSSSAPTSSAPVTTDTKATERRKRSGAAANARPEKSSVRVQVLAAILHRAATPSGRRRQRARLSVHVRVINRGARTIGNVRPVLLGASPVRPDPAQRTTTGSLQRPVPARATADGTLRFETAGAVTARLVSGRRGRLRIAGKIVRLNVVIGTPAQ